MRKIYLLFLLSSCLSLILFSFLNYKRDDLIFTDNINNLEKKVEDSITPSCLYTSNNEIEKSLNNFKAIDIIIPESRKWSINLLNAWSGDQNIIQDKYKKRFNANVYLKNYRNEVCILPARVRISGDWTDHIQSINGIILASLDVHLTKGNINGITKFKLFIPSTKKGSSEVLISLLLREMGYLSPRTNILKVSVNNQSYEMIFQEKAAKEMIEYNNLRESAIIESDESLLWETRTKYFLNNGKIISNANNIFPKVVNKKWIKKNSINQKIGLEGMKIFSNALLDSWNHGGLNEEITLSDNLLSNGNIKNKKILSRFKAHLIASGSDHALYSHNRRFYYDPINKSLIPIYYDGNSKIRKLGKNYLEKVDKKRFLTRDIRFEDYNYAIKELKAIDLPKFIFKLNSAGVLIKESELIKIQEQLIKNLIVLRGTNQIKLKKKFENNPLKRKMINGVKYGLILYSESNRNFYLCNLEEDKCKKTKFSDLELNKILTGKFIKDDVRYYFLSDKFDPVTKIYNQEIPNKLDLINIENTIYIKKYGSPRISFYKKEKLISIEIDNFNQKVLFIDSKLLGWNIRVNSKVFNHDKKIGSRIDTNLLTSLITIKDSYMENLKIYIEGGKHEDSLNIINSSGSIEKINIKNSFQDAIDFDFSNLEVNEIYVKNSRNDCIDVSAGNYFINKLTLNECEDKGISAGEKSTIKINKAEIKNSNIALVSKDSSQLIVKKVFLKNNKFCFAAYNKKQEFGPSSITISNQLCPKKKLLIQNHSILNIL